MKIRLAISFLKAASLLIVLCLFASSCAKPLAQFIPKVNKSTVPTKVSFENQSKNADTFIWDFGDGKQSSDKNPQHTFYLSGKYNVSLLAIKGKQKNKNSVELFFAAPQDCLVEVETSFGSMIFKLFDHTPLHRDNFVKLAENGYYDGVLFHRVIAGFMAQAGDPDSKKAKKGERLGGGGPSYTIDQEIGEQHFHLKGALAAARQGDDVNPLKKSSGSQFYIVHGRQYSSQQLDVYEEQKNIRYSKQDREVLLTQGGAPQLDKEYTVFGQIIEGLDVLDKIASAQTDQADRPIEDIKILKVKVIK